MLQAIFRSVSSLVLFTLLLGGAYPLLITGLGKIFFRGHAGGSFLPRPQGDPVGSLLIGQIFTQPKYFHGRPSASDYDATHSGGSNLGPTNPKWFDLVKSRAAQLLTDNPGVKTGQLPVDLLTASGSGLDPHISPEAALFQVKRVAQARGLPPEHLHHLVTKHLEGPQFGLFGEPVLNVLILNFDLDHFTDI